MDVGKAVILLSLANLRFCWQMMTISNAKQLSSVVHINCS